MNERQIKETLDKLPSKRKQVLLKILAGDTKIKIACELCNGSEEAVQQHLRQLYKNFDIQGDEERKLPALITLFANKKPELISSNSQIVRGSENEEKTVNQPQTPSIPCSAYDEETWVERGELSRQLSEKLRGQCRVLVITGIAGQGKTALAERLASVELREDWQQYKCVNFYDRGMRDFVSAADTLLTQLGEEVTADERKNADGLLNRLVQKLRNHRYFVQIDSLEFLLKGKGDEDTARNEFENERWWEFFNRLLAGGECQSRLILTSQDLPTQFKSCQSRRFWHEERLTGLDENEHFELFQKLFHRDEKEIPPESETADYLKRMGKAYEGHPLVIEVIVGEILAQPFNGNVVAYWNKYRQEFEAIEAAIGHQELQLRVKDRVRKSLERLQQDVPYAYTLLLRSSVYRHPVPERFWLSMLGSCTEQEKATALGTIESRYLVFREAVTHTGQFLLRQHNLIRNTAYELLRKISNQGLEWQDDHYIAAEMWRTAYEPEPDASNLEKVQGYLEAFHHFSEVGFWEEVSQILSIRLDIPSKEQLHNQLGIWGYYHQQIELYNRMLGKLNDHWNGICYGGLGNAYYFLGNYSQAIEYLQQHLTIAQKIGERKGEGTALGNLGIVYQTIGNYPQVIEYYEQHLTITRQIGDCKGEGTALGNLGSAYYFLGEYPQAIDYYQQSLTIAREIGDCKSEGTALGNLGSVYRTLGNYPQAIDYCQQSLTIAREIGDRKGEGSALGNLGSVYYSLGNYLQAIDYYQQSLTIAQQIGDRKGEGIALGNLGSACSCLGKYPESIDYIQQHLTIAREIRNRHGEGTALGNLGNTLFKIEQYSEALEKLQTALKIFLEIGYRSGQAVIFNDLAELHLKLGDRALALEYCDRALSIATDLGIPLAKECQELKEKLLSEEA
ncbi:tetratricopeptide repeat protein [Coleofasciculus sp. FACHB-542]|uniref:tetratricopeptide repeat protein n=1 Tax=Cyanophyceae TaxID=3028117 RepID=UPI001685203F|nr:tetratricopeptide repeat protein [Coleofasciculus sp. FACHB-542]MBD2087116.1 ATP-binding protein [Coleofasciculus sp. FACHB-542]